MSSFLAVPCSPQVPRRFPSNWETALLVCVLISAKVQHISLEEKALLLGCKYSHRIFYFFCEVLITVTI